ncbi:hypothetical protein EMMF5_002464 [Cystobasidiomycetes sp. EMM_F5]
MIFFESSSHPTKEAIIATLGLLSLSVASVAARPAPGIHARDASSFVSRNGTRLYQNGKPFYVSGMNYWSCMNLAADLSAGGNTSRFETEMQQMKAAGINMIRIMAASEGAPTIQPNRMYPPLMPSPYHWNEDIFVGMDRCVAKAAEYGMTTIMTLQNTWNWSGGMGQYVSWMTGNGSIPYPPSWDYTANPPYGNYTNNGTWNGYIDPPLLVLQSHDHPLRLPSSFPYPHLSYIDYTGQFYNNTDAQQLYRAHISKVINRKNTVSGKMYKEDPAILAWELANEPQPPFPYEWVDGTASYIKSLAPNQLVTTGFEGKQGEAWWKLIHKSPNIDLCSAHWWVQNQGIYDPTNTSAVNLQVAIDSVTTFLGNVSQWATDLGKPAILEEAGMARDEWQNVARGAPTKSYLYNSTATITNRDAYFGVILSEVLNYFKLDKSIVGQWRKWAYIQGRLV